MIQIFHKLFKFFILGSLILIASYYAMEKDKAILIDVGMILLAAAFISKIVEVNIVKRKRK